MTFRQIIDVLWFRRWLILAIVALSLVAGAVVAVAQPRVYESTVTLRTSPLVTEAGSSGQLGGVQVDFGPTSADSREVLTDAAELAGEAGTDLSDDITVDVVSDSATDTIYLTAHATDPATSLTRVTAVTDAYRAYLEATIDDTLVTLGDRQAAALSAATQFQAEVTADSEDLIALANLQNALGSLASINDSITSIQNAGAPVSVLSAGSPGYLIGTSLLILLLLALACGLIAGIGVALIRDQFDDRLRGDSELERYVGAPSLAELAEERSLSGAGDLPAATRHQSTLTEGLRSLRTALQVLLPTAHAVIAVTSVEPGDGKSFVAANIAVTWAKAGKQTIIVGGDLRRPSLASYFGTAAEGAGLTEILLDAALKPAGTASATTTAADVMALLNDTDFPGLRVLPAGDLIGDPADLLATPALAATISALRSIADIVVIDCPPAMRLADASLLAEQSDGAVLLASVGRTSRTLLTQASEELRQNGVTILGAVANRSRRKLPQSYSAYYTRADAAPRDA
jgi:polysaccharide biosynthesis transport protein